MSETLVTSKTSENSFGSWLLWALGIRRPRADADYGEALLRYRSWSTWPVSIMSMAVFLLIAVKISILIGALTSTFNSLSPEAVVLEYSLNTPIPEILAITMFGIIAEVLHAVPLWLMIPLWLMWFLAFVVDFIVCAVLATPKGKWWKTHWGGIITAILTIP